MRVHAEGGGGEGGGSEEERSKSEVKRVEAGRKTKTTWPLGMSPEEGTTPHIDKTCHISRLVREGFFMNLS